MVFLNPQQVIATLSDGGTAVGFDAETSVWVKTTKAKALLDVSPKYSEAPLV